MANWDIALDEEQFRLKVQSINDAKIRRKKGSIAQELRDRMRSEKIARARRMNWQDPVYRAKQIEHQKRLGLRNYIKI